MRIRTLVKNTGWLLCTSVCTGVNAGTVTLMSSSATHITINHEFTVYDIGDTDTVGELEINVGAIARNRYIEINPNCKAIVPWQESSSEIAPGFTRYQEVHSHANGPAGAVVSFRLKNPHKVKPGFTYSHTLPLIITCPSDAYVTWRHFITSNNSVLLNAIAKIKSTASILVDGNVVDLGEIDAYSDRYQYVNGSKNVALPMSARPVTAQYAEEITLGKNASESVLRVDHGSVVGVKYSLVGIDAADVIVSTPRGELLQNSVTTLGSGEVMNLTNTMSTSGTKHGAMVIELTVQ